MSGARGARAIRSAFVVWDRLSSIRIRLERGGSTGGTRTGVSRVAGAVSVMCALLGSVRSSECRGHGREARGDFSSMINGPRQVVTCTVQYCTRSLLFVVVVGLGALESVSPARSVSQSERGVVSRSHPALIPPPSRGTSTNGLLRGGEVSARAHTCVASPARSPAPSLPVENKYRVLATGSQSGSAAPVQPQVPSTRSKLSCVHVRSR